MTTTERIANAIKHILEEDRRADRERIAELERDAALTRAWAERRQDLDATIDDLNRQLDEAHKENARLVMEREHTTLSGAALGMIVRANTPVVEEQGPWVIQDQDRSPSNDLPWAGVCSGDRTWKTSGRLRLALQQNSK